MKIKSHKSASKRFRKVSRGSIVRRNQSDQHLSRRKSPRSRRNAAKSSKLRASDKKKIQLLIPG